MVITKYYANGDALNKCEEPYRSVVELLDPLFFEAPAECEILTAPSFSSPHVVSAVRTIYEILKKNMLLFNQTLLYIYRITVASNNKMHFDNFLLTSPYRIALLFGAVYYVAAQDLSFQDKHLKNIEMISCSNKSSTNIFNYFKSVADKKREELKAHTSLELKENDALSVVENEKSLPPSKRIVLNNQSETARVVKAMAMAGYFKHEDGSRVSEAEVGRKFCSLFGVKSTWDSLVQSAFRVEDISGTFETLKTTAINHYKKVNNIKD